MLDRLVRRVLPAVAALVLPAPLPAQAGDGAPAEFFENSSKARGRYTWHYSRRAWPADTLVQGYIGKALRDLARAGAQSSALLSWEEIGPRPGTLGSYGNVAGRITALAAHPADPAVAWAGAADGGVWRTTDGGGTWTPLTDALASLATGCLALDPAHPATLLWGTGEPYYAADAYGGAGVFRSTTGGDEWVSIGLEHEKRITALSVSPADGSILAAAWGGVYRTPAPGAAWTRTLAAGYAYSLAAHPTNPHRIYAGIGDNAAAAGIYLSADGGTTWNRLGGGLPPPEEINRVALAVSRSSPSTIYALFSARDPFGALLGLYKSVNGGATWTRLPGVPADLFGSLHQGWYDITIGIHPTNPALVFIGGIGLYRSTNGGSSWWNVSGLTVHPDQHALAFGPGVIYLGNDGGVWKSVNNGAAWTNLNSGLAVTQFYSAATDRQSPDRVYGGTQDNGTQRTTGSSAWRGVLGGDGGMVVVDAGSSDRVFAQTPHGRLYRSTDGGESFTYLHDAGGAWITPLRQDPFEGGTFYTANTRVLRSTDRGSSWSAWSPVLNASAPIQWLTPDPGAPGGLYAASYNRVFRTGDGGETWERADAGLPDRFIEQVVPDPADPSTLYAVTSGVGTGHVFMSTDRGASWRSRSEGVPDVPATSLLVSPADRDLLLLGTDLGLWVSTDRGIRWRKEEGLPNAAVADLALDAHGRVVAATHGRSMFRAPLPGMPPILVLSPREGETVPPGGTLVIRWATAGVDGDVRVELIRNGGQEPIVLAERTVNDGTDVWHAWHPPAAGLRVKISSLRSPSVSASSGLFAIAPPVEFLAHLTVGNAAGQRDSLAFGGAGGATPGIDPAYGERELPPVPPSTMFDARWQIAGTLGVALDVRPRLAEGAAMQVYEAVLQSGRGGYPLTLRWERTQLPPGVLSLRDAYTGGALFEADMHARDSLVITNPAVGRVQILHAAPDTVTVRHAAGWNLVSLPVEVPDPAVARFFPDATSRAFTFTPDGYAGSDVLAGGAGYWVKAADAERTFIGIARTADTVAVRAGWNMIGSLTRPVPAESVRTVPDGLLLSPLVGRNGPEGSIEPGRAYWVKASGPGLLILQAPLSPPSR